MISYATDACELKAFVRMSRHSCYLFRVCATTALYESINHTFRRFPPAFSDVLLSVVDLVFSSLGGDGSTANLLNDR